MTLYEVLGLTESAIAAEIKAAHRQAVKTHHPDVGGDAATFERVQRAYAILSDPERRAHYDSTGLEDDPGAATADQLAQAAISALIVQFIGSQDDLDRTDIVAAIRNVFLRQKAGHEETCRQIDMRLMRVKTIRRRLHRKDDTGELEAVLSQRERELYAARAGEETQIAVVDRALGLLHGYSYRLDLTPADEMKIWSALKP